jgi:hypothetical protein
VLGRGFDQFRLDAVIPDGTRSYILSHGVGSLKNTDGSVTNIPYHNTINAGMLTFPYLTIEARLGDPLTAFVDTGLATGDSGSALHQIRVQQRFPATIDPQGILTSLCVTDYFVDPATGLIVKTVDQTHSPNNMNQSCTHEVDFENYRAVNGVNVPFLVREKVCGNTIWELQLASISFNVGLSDPNFVLQ